jgi:hypothetical protein
MSHFHFKLQSKCLKHHKHIFFQMPMLHNESHHITKHAHNLDLSHCWSWIDSKCDPNFYNNRWVPLEMFGLFLSMFDEWLWMTLTPHVPSRQSSIWRCSLPMLTNETWMKMFGVSLVSPLSMVAKWPQVSIDHANEYAPTITRCLFSNHNTSFLSF